MEIVKDGMVIDPVIQSEIIARAVAGNFGDQPSQTIHSLGTVTTPDGKEVRIHVGHAVDAIILGTLMAMWFWSLVNTILVRASRRYREASLVRLRGATASRRWKML